MKLWKFKWSQLKTWGIYDRGIYWDTPYHDPKDATLKIEEHETLICLVKSVWGVIHRNIYIDVYDKA